jgi:hypothetical protein
MWVKLTAEKVLDTVMEWERDGEVLLQVAIVMDEERGQQTVLNALEQFLNESNLSWRKKRKRKESTALHDTSNNESAATPSLPNINSNDNVHVTVLYAQSDSDDSSDSSRDNIPLSMLTR